MSFNRSVPADRKFAGKVVQCLTAAVGAYRHKILYTHSELTGDVYSRLYAEYVAGRKRNVVALDHVGALMHRKADSVSYAVEEKIHRNLRR